MAEKCLFIAISFIEISQHRKQKCLVCNGPKNEFFFVFQFQVSFISVLKNFVKWYDTIEVQSNTEVYSSFATIYINPVIKVISWLGWRKDARSRFALFNLCCHGCAQDRVGLEQCCPTLSPFATCGDMSFKCGDRKFFQKLFYSQNIN